MAEATYGMNYSNFIGVDVSSDPRVVARNRLAHSVNMWRDYESEQGAAVETFPGFRVVAKYPHKDAVNWSGVIENIWYLKGKRNDGYFIINNNSHLLYIKINELKNAISPIGFSAYDIYFERKNVLIGGASNITSNANAFTANNNLYVVDKSGMYKIWDRGEALSAEQVTNFYIPTTYYNGKPYEQRNALGVSGSGDEKYQIVKEIYTNATETRKFENKIPNQAAEEIDVSVYKINEKTLEYPFSSGNIAAISKVTVDGVEYEYSDEIYGFYFPKDDSKYLNTFLVERMGTGPNGTGGGEVAIVTEIFMPKEKVDGKKVEITYRVQPTHFNKIGDLVNFQNEKVTMAEAILGCTKSAVYDGRIFLTGNPDLPNTVFYSQRNLTGANDPTYFGVYNYFNDGDGNTPNVDMLAMPNMLMVIKRDTTQDGSIYYHVGADNPHSDESVRNLVPRIYPSSTGAAGLGSAGLTDAYSLSCNFLDDPVFLSRRGLEGITKEQLNAERTVQHRSSTIDRFLIKEDLAHASLAEWKGYLVVCCNGHIYLADSRTRTQNAYGSFQYEWFYLEGVGTYDTYRPAYKKMTSYPDIEGFDEACKKSGIELWEKDDGEVLFDSGVISEPINEMTVYYYKDDNGKRLLDITDQRVGQGFHGAKRVLAVGELLFFATDHDICLFNTDKRGEQIYLKDDENNDILDEDGRRILVREVDSDKIDSSWYTFGGVPYISGCSIRLDDCEKKTVTKANVYGTTVARFKMIPGSRCKIKSSINGRDWKKIGEGHASRFDFGDLRFDNTSFTENEDSVYVLPEVSRGWVSKQYYFYSDGFCEPFGLYELSYNYRIVGKIRR